MKRSRTYIAPMRFTPGPWIVDDRHVHRKFGTTYPPDSPVNRNAMIETDVIVEVDTSCHPGGLLTETDKANLQLISAAPEMLEALKKIEVIVRGGVIHRHETGKPQWSAFDEIKQITRAAILMAHIRPCPHCGSISHPPGCCAQDGHGG